MYQRKILIVQVEQSELHEGYQPVTSEELEKHDTVILCDRSNYRVVKNTRKYINPKHIYHLTCIYDIISCGVIR